MSAILPVAIHVQMEHIQPWKGKPRVTLVWKGKAIFLKMNLVDVAKQGDTHLQPLLLSNASLVSLESG
jgi:hypothetical protein